jgi:hypothetical protein
LGYAPLLGFVPQPNLHDGLVVYVRPVLKGKPELPNKKLKMVQAWIAIHEEELVADWKLASEGKEIFNIDPLR